MLTKDAKPVGNDAEDDLASEPVGCASPDLRALVDNGGHSCGVVPLSKTEIDLPHCGQIPDRFAPHWRGSLVSKPEKTFGTRAVYWVPTKLRPICMDLTLINDGARAIHLLGLALGYGVGILADMSAARMKLRPLEARE